MGQRVVAVVRSISVVTLFLLWCERELSEGGGGVMGRDEVVVYDGAACLSRVRKNETSVVLAGVQGDPDHLQLPQGNFEAVSLLLPDFYFSSLYS